MFFGQHAGIGEGIAYQPVSILRACALVLNLLIGILRYEGKAKITFQELGFFQITCIVLISYLSSLVHFTMPVCTDFEIFAGEF